MTEGWTPQNVSQVGKLRLVGGGGGRWGDLRTAHSRPGPTPAQSPALGLSEGTLSGGARTSGGSDPAGGPGGSSGGGGDNRQAGRAGYEEEEQGDTVGCWPAVGRGGLTAAVCTTAETSFWDPATGEASTNVWPFSARGPSHYSIPVGSSAGGRGSPPGTFKETDRERRPCVLVTHQHPLWFGPAAVGAWASTSWATCAWPLSLCLGLEQQPLHRLVEHVEVLVGRTM